MDGISEMMGKVFNPTVGKAATAGVGVLGEIGNIITGMRGNDISKNAAAQQALLLKIMQNPALLAAMIKSVRAPLSQNLTNNVGNQTQAFLAERGLGSSPNIAASVEGQAIAPYELKTQEDAQNAILQMLGIAQGSTTAAAGALPKPADTTSLWKLFQPSDPTGGAPSGGISGNKGITMDTQPAWPLPPDMTPSGGGGGGGDLFGGYGDQSA